uniref:Uncharacterized protein n=1 Tax=viral metagenome TaxID=1070528 RepID=A0A6C0L198_9ZZZZ
MRSLIIFISLFILSSMLYHSILGNDKDIPKCKTLYYLDDK